MTPQQLVKGMIGALWIGCTADELEDLKSAKVVTFLHFNRYLLTLVATPQCPNR